jgi:hypothetical protein
MKRFKHLKNYKKFNPNNKVNEGWQTWANIAASALQLIPGMGRAISGPQSKTTFVLGQEKQQGDAEKGTLKIAVGTTSNDKCWYNGIGQMSEIQSAVPKSKDGKMVMSKSFMKTTIEKLNQALESGVKNPFEVFEYTDSTTTKAIEATLKEPGNGHKSYLKYNEKGLPDYIKIGGKSIEGKGIVNFSWEDSGEIIVSGNGAYALLRVYSENLKNGKAKINVMDIGNVEVADAKTEFINQQSFNMKTSISKDQYVQIINYLFEMTTEMGNKNPNTDWWKDSGVLVNYDEARKNLIGKSDQEIIDEIFKNVFLMNNDFMPTDKNGNFIKPEKLPSFFKELDLQVMDTDKIKSYIERFQQTKDQSERDKIYIEFMTDNMKIWQNNFNLVMNGFSQKYNISGLPQISDAFINSYIKNSVMGKHFDTQEEMVETREGERIFKRRLHVNDYKGQKGAEYKKQLKKSVAGEEEAGTKIGELPKSMIKDSFRYLKRFKRF